MAYDRREDRSGSRKPRGKGGDRHGFNRRRDDERGSRGHGRDGRGRGQRDAAGRRARGQESGTPKGGSGSRQAQRSRVPEPPVPSDVAPRNLDASARRELRGLGRLNADNVARHLVMVQRLLDSDPESAYEHARYAASHAGRVAVVRESAGIAAYLAGHYNDALREIRAARRLSGLDLHRAIEADCERALGRYNQALKVAQEADPSQLDDLEEAEIAMVVSGVRHDMGQSELGLVVIEEAIMMFRGDRETLRRLHSVRADRLEELGRGEEAARIRERIGVGDDQEPTEQVEVYDIEDDYEEETRTAAGNGPQASADDAAGAASSAGVEDDAASSSADSGETVAETAADGTSVFAPEEDGSAAAAAVVFED